MSGCGFILPRQEAGNQVLDVVECSLTKIVRVNQLKLSKQFHLQNTQSRSQEFTYKESHYFRTLLTAYELTVAVTWLGRNDYTSCD